MIKVCIPNYINSTFVENNVILLDQKKNTYYALNESAADFWKLLMQLGSIDAAIDELSKLYNLSKKEIETDIKKLVQNLVDNGILEELYS
jgi:hypothetical protein